MFFPQALLEGDGEAVGTRHSRSCGEVEAIWVSGRASGGDDFTPTTAITPSRRRRETLHTVHRPPGV
jgi:hypothetical protein